MKSNDKLCLKGSEMVDNIKELNAHEPTVESVISRLVRHKSRIKSITAIVEWENGTSGVYHEDKSLPHLSLELLIMQDYLLNILKSR